jgi:hypothetical protein
LLNRSAGFSRSANFDRDVLLVYPGKFKAIDPQVPLSLLHIAGSLKQEGFGVRILTCVSKITVTSA